MQPIHHPKIAKQLSGRPYKKVTIEFLSCIAITMILQTDWQRNARSGTIQNLFVLFCRIVFPD